MKKILILCLVLVCAGCDNENNSFFSGKKTDVTTTKVTTTTQMTTTTADIDSDPIYYKMITKTSEVEELLASKKTSMLVLGQTGCGWCTQFKEVMNEVAKNNNVDLYYIDLRTIDEAERNNIMSMDINIPASCSSTGKEKKIGQGFGTPLTLFIKNNKTTDCIAEYIKEDLLIDKLKTVGMIK